MRTCAACSAKVEVYLLLISGIEQQPRPVFDFDLSASVLKQLQPSRPKAVNDKLVTWILVFVSIGFIAGAAYYFRSYLASLFEGVATILIYLIVISAITVIAALVFDMYKKYQKEMKVLDL
jgi:ABC-type transport system involved in cytochrome bd biosynthesis fused ATPase/permease subunit